MKIDVNMGKNCPKCGKPGAMSLDGGQTWGACMKCLDKHLKRKAERRDRPVTVRASQRSGKTQSAFSELWAGRGK